RGWGLLRALAVPAPLAGMLSLLLLDLAIWAQHVAMHRVPLLWRLHRVHHTDTDFDTSTALRFHPLEIGLSMLWKIVLVLALGAPVAAVAGFELLLSACALFNHANLALPAPVDAWLRRVLITPDVHRIHHSIHRDETDSNFGFSVVWWDHLFGTWRSAPRDGHATMTIGLDGFRAPQAQRLGALLLQPLRRDG
ncbi:MAG TPA: sterol desaturase family protein, partial [Plasticicumulans sp.]|uniref:sterol desaturase family protein n=2 Tax=Plasticicumulans sp. TaxID=2307179 RepID=UPI002D1E26A0